MSADQPLHVGGWLMDSSRASLSRRPASKKGGRALAQPRSVAASRAASYQQFAN